MSFESHYPDGYGRWAGNPIGAKPDYKRCCAAVCGASGYHALRETQCARKNGHGPDGAYCKQHDPAAVEARRANADAKAEAMRIEHSFQWYGKRFAKALKKIADGDNDPRTTAREALGDLYDKIETKG